MKLLLITSIPALLTLFVLLKPDVNIQSSQPEATQVNPLKGSKSLIRNIKSLPMDFSELKTPYSQDSQDTQVAGLLRTDTQGNLITDDEFKAFMDYFLSSVGEVTPEQALQRMRLLFFQQLPESAAKQAMTVLEQYLAFKEDSIDALSQDVDSHRSEVDAQYRYEKLQQGLQILHDLRRTHLGDQVAKELFYQEEAFAKYTLTKMQTQLNTSISDEERQQIYDLAKAELPEEMAEILTEQEKQTRKIQAYTDKLNESPSLEDMREFAFENFNSANAQQIMTDYEQQLALKSKYNEFLQAKVDIQQQGLSKQDQQQALQELLHSHFNDEEASMVQAWQLAEQ